PRPPDSPRTPGAEVRRARRPESADRARRGGGARRARWARARSSSRRGLAVAAKLRLYYGAGPMERRELMGLSREELVARAERLGVARPRVLTQPELMDEILTRTTKNERERTRQRGWLGRARDLIAGVVERGLHLPEVARAL